MYINTLIFNIPICARGFFYREYREYTSLIRKTLLTFLETGAILAYSDATCTFVFLFLYSAALITQLFVLSTLFNQPNLALGKLCFQRTKQLNNFIWTNRKQVQFCFYLPIGHGRYVLYTHFTFNN